MILQGETGRKKEEEKKKLSKSAVRTHFSTRSIKHGFQDVMRASPVEMLEGSLDVSTRWSLLVHGLSALKAFIEAQNLMRLNQRLFGTLSQLGLATSFVLVRKRPPGVICPSFMPSVGFIHRTIEMAETHDQKTGATLIVCMKPQ